MTKVEEVIGRPLVLIVEDEPVIASEFGAELQNAGADVVCLSCARALERLEGWQLAAAVLDNRPASGPRRALLRELRRRKVPFLLYGDGPPPSGTTGRDALFIARPSPSRNVVIAVAYLMAENIRLNINAPIHSILATQRPE